MSTINLPVFVAAAPAVQSYLQYVKSEVNKILYPQTNGSPVQIPHYDTLYTAAGKLDMLSDTDATQHMNMIMSMLGRASCVDFTVPTSLNLPEDHHMHPGAGAEWYWIACHLQVKDPNGNKGRISVLVDMTRNRCIGLQAQNEFKWTDEQATLANTIANVTIDMDNGDKSYHRRTPNWQWPMKGGSVSFSTPGNDFSFTCGPDTLSGSANVLPLDVSINDGSNMQIDLTLTNQTGINVESAYFLQGMPQITGGGNGVTPVPTPGIYYSWPQLQVSGSLTVDGTTYTVVSGTGWIDHEIMMTSLENADNAYAPVPFIDDSKPYNGWVWQFYNFTDNTAFTGAGFVHGAMSYTPVMPYGYYLQPDGSGGWTAIFINGDITLLDPETYPSQCGEPNSAPVTIPTSRTYAHVENELLGNPLAGTVKPWYTDGTFNFPDGSICAEEPGDYTDTSGHHANGVGYMETVGFQSVADYQAYVLSVLQGNS